MTGQEPQGLLARIFATELRMWRGEAPLARVFWGHGVLLSTVFLTVYGATIYFGWVQAEQFMMLCIALYSVWILVAIWRTAAGNETAWGLLARMLTVAWALNVAMIFLFRELDLVSVLFRP